MSNRRPLTDEELLQLVNEMSDIEYLSDEDDEEIDELDIADENGEGNVEEGIIEDDLVEDVTGFVEEVDVLQTEDFGELTPKKDIHWQKGLTYITPAFKWFEERYQDIVELESPYRIFKKYFPDKILHQMVECTNIYAAHQGHQFKPTSLEEIQSFIGIHILMGNLNYPRIKCYWEPKLRIAQIADAMPINRFYKLRQNVHFVDVTKDADPNDRFWKVRPIFNSIRERLLSLPLEAHLSIDEQMVPFKGSLNVKQYVKGKPKPWGIKIFAICGTSGQMFDFIIYQGSTTELDPAAVKCFGQGAAVVVKLSNRINENNCRLYFDNYFSNYNLLQFLRNKNIYAVCTARQNRFNNPPFSSDKDMKKLGRGCCEQLISGDGEVIITKWYDNKPVVLASNYLGIGNEDFCKRWDKREKKYVEVKRPEVIQTYN